MSVTNPPVSTHMNGGVPGDGGWRRCEDKAAMVRRLRELLRRIPPPPVCIHPFTLCALSVPGRFSDICG